jgi:hypothetical protein
VSTKPAITLAALLGAAPLKSKAGGKFYASTIAGIFRAHPI